MIEFSENITVLKTSSQIENFCREKCIVLAYMNGCPSCIRFKQVYEELARAGEIALKCYAVERNSEAFKTLEQLAPKKIQVFPTTLVFCKRHKETNNSLLSFRASIQLDGTQSYEDLLKAALEACAPLYYA